jgi:hypothetical protein
MDKAQRKIFDVLFEIRYLINELKWMQKEKRERKIKTRWQKDKLKFNAKHARKIFYLK